ncbi:sugar phosphate isomerase/epimerase [Phenylobacterium sp.]|uniref:sugar phosphate isomerase/epimerase family protein n=1 Tax=Phenylobacterium sp. TaxID=1871053 RepID=UPI002F410BB8
MIELSRRAAIGAGLAGAAAALGPGSVAAATGTPFFKRTGLPIGLQLYTLGDGLKADLDGQLGQVAKAGYRSVEMAGYLGRSPQELRAAFDKAGLVCPSAHFQARSSATEPGLADVDKVIADAHVLGIRHIVLPMFAIPAHVNMTPSAGEDRRAVLARLATQMTADDWKATADFLNAKAAPLKAAGLTLGYHNHNVEFAPLGATTGMDILLKNTDPALVSFEMDAGWVVAAGADPFALLKARPHRFTQMHVKDVKATTKPNFAFQQDPTEVGSGTIDWKRLLPASYAAGVRGFFVEQEAPYDKPRMESVRISGEYLNGLVA